MINKINLINLIKQAIFLALLNLLNEKFADIPVLKKSSCKFVSETLDFV